MNDEICFIDNSGKKIYCEGIESHIGLAQLILESNEELMEKYKKSKIKDMVDFLVIEKGYLKVSSEGYYYRVVTFQLSKISDEQKKILLYYRAHGFRLDNLPEYRVNAECR